MLWSRLRQFLAGRLDRLALPGLSRTLARASLVLTLFCILYFTAFGAFDALTGKGRILAELFGGSRRAIYLSFLRVYPDLLLSLGQTVFMVFFSTLLSFIIGFALSMLMVITGPQGLRPLAPAYAALDFVVDILRSLPFIILIIFIMPFTRLIVGTPIGTMATIVPLTVAAAPFAARIIEANFLEVDRGVVEAARSFGAGTLQIIFRVMLPEALPSIVLNVAVLAIALVGYSAMAGTVGGGGLGDLAFRLGYTRFQDDVTLWCIIILLILVRCIQLAG
ncbi:ABC transporter permease, partial [Desulfovibrio sp. OttesenSCG-928-A18]|nr:ABC transporter permease [Desulfovibrio sp. OttesenSCG-928-A18]